MKRKGDRMRITHVKVSGIPGLQPVDLDFPSDQPVIAITGPNGTGKSRLLRAMGSFGFPGGDGRATPPGEVEVTVEVGEDTAQALLEGWTDHPADESSVLWANRPRPEVPRSFTLTSGGGLRIDPRIPYPPGALGTGIPSRAYPGHPLNDLRVMYVPAHRRFDWSSDPKVDLTAGTPKAGMDTVFESEASAYASGSDLRDEEFSAYALGLYLQTLIPAEDGIPASDALHRWEDLKDSMNQILAPKALAEPTANDMFIRVKLPAGGLHRLDELSSGEQQALGLVGRVARANWDGGLILIDDPDAFLHPTLAKRLIESVKNRFGSRAHVVMATHSAEILNSVPPAAILQLSHDAPAAWLTDERDRVSAYRRAGFRASVITQADSILIVEGVSDADYLPILSPLVSSANTQTGNGRRSVELHVETLARYDLPVIGVLDRDVIAPTVHAEISHAILVWKAADIEAVFLSDDQFLQAALDGHLLKPEWSNLETVRAELERLLLEREESVVAELAQWELRPMTQIKWPEPKWNEPLDQLRAVAGTVPQLDAAAIEMAILNARTLWDGATDKWELVRGKDLSGSLFKMITAKTTGDFFRQTAAHRPHVAEVERLEAMIKAARLA